MAEPRDSTLEELSREYMHSAELLFKRVAELRKELPRTTGRAERLMLQRRIAMLEDMARDAKGTSAVLGRYHRKPGDDDN